MDASPSPIAISTPGTPPGASSKTTATSIIPAALFFLVPLFALALAVRIIVHHPRSGRKRNWTNPQVYTAYAMITVLALLGALAGALPLSQALARAGHLGAELDERRTEEIFQALLGFLVGVAVLQLTPASVNATAGKRMRAVCGKIYSVALGVVLCSATLLALLAPFLSSATSSQAELQTFRIPPFLPPALFIAYTVLALPRVLRAFVHHLWLQPTSKDSSDNTYTPAYAPTSATLRPSPAYNLDFGYDPAASRASSAASTTIKVPVTFPFPYPPRTRTPIARGKPAWLSALGLDTPTPTSTPTSSRRTLRTQVSLSALSTKAGLGLGSVKLKSLAGGSTTANPGTMRRPITIHVATQRTSWTYPGKDAGGNGSGEGEGVRVSLPSPTVSSSEESHGHERHQSHAGKADDNPTELALPSNAYAYPPGEKWASNRRGSASTVGTESCADSEINLKGLGFGSGLGVPPPPLTPIESDVEVTQYRRSIDGEEEDSGREWESSEESGRGGRIGPGFAAHHQEHDRGSLGGITIVDGAARGGGSGNHSNSDRELVGKRMRCVLVWVLGAQLCALGAWVCALAIGLEVDMARADERFDVVRAMFVVLAVVGTMGAYFVHSSNTRLVAAPRIATHKPIRTGYLHNGTQAPLVTTTTTTTISPMADTVHNDLFSALPASAYTPITSSGSYAYTYGHRGSATVRNTNNFNNIHNHNTNNNGDDDNVQGYSVHTPPLTAMYAASPTQTVDLRTLSSRPSVIQLASPPPSRTHRRRADAGLGLDGARTQSRAGSLVGTRSSGSHTHEPLLARDASVHERVSALQSDAHGYEAPGEGNTSLFEMIDSLRLSSSMEADGSFEGEVSLEKMYEDELEVEEDAVDDMERVVRGLLLSRTSPLSSSVGARTQLRRASVKRLSNTTPSHSRNNSIGYNDDDRSQQTEPTTPTTPKAKKILGAGDTGVYIHKRGSLPVASTARKFFRWDAAPSPIEDSGASRGNAAKKSASMRELRERRGEGASFIDLQGDHGLGRGLSLGGSAKDGGRTKRQSLLSGVVPMGGVEEVESTEPKGVERSREESSSIVRRLTKRAQSASKSIKAATLVSPTETAARTVQLKKSFKLGVGRTMGPGLTLAVASTLPKDESYTREEGEGYEEEGKSETLGMKMMGEATREDDGSTEGYGNREGEEDGDEEGEICSIAAARLVSASIARSTPAATLLAVPTTPSRSGHRISYTSGYSLSPTKEAMAISRVSDGRPASPALIATYPVSPTSPIRSPISAKATSLNKSRPTSRNAWKPHPFADSSDEHAPLRSPVGTQMDAVGVEEGKEGDDEVLQLEREMEEIRGRNSDLREADSEKALRDFHAVLNPAGACRLNKTHSDSGNADEDRLAGRSIGHAQTRTSLSAPPVPKSNWVPQTSLTTGSFPYRFPMIFGSSTGSSSGSGSPPRPLIVLSSVSSNQPNSTSGTPRGGTSTLRLPSRTMDTVRNAFAGVSARMSRISVVPNSIGGPANRGGEPGPGVVDKMAAEDSDGDFMDLRDPFASPPPVAKISSPSTKKTMKAAAGGDSSKEWVDNFPVINAAYGTDEGENSARVSRGARGDGRTKRRMSAWGRLPMPARTLSPVPSSAGGASVVFAAGKKSSIGNNKAVIRTSRGKPVTKKGKKERRTRKVTLPSMAGTLIPTKSGTSKVGEEDADFGLEEALLSQRLLKRLDSAEWEIRG